MLAVRGKTPSGPNSAASAIAFVPTTAVPFSVTFVGLATTSTDTVIASVPIEILHGPVRLAVARIANKFVIFGTLTSPLTFVPHHATCGTLTRSPCATMTPFVSEADGIHCWTWATIL